MNILMPRPVQPISEMAAAQQVATRMALLEQSKRAAEEEDDYIYDEGFTSQVKQYDPTVPILLTLALGGIAIALFSQYSSSLKKLLK
jgi:hypothetical protein